MARADTLRTDNADFEDAADLIDALGTEAANGWIVVDEDWTYLGSATVGVPSGATTRFQAGDKIKFDNTTTKYFVVQSVTSTQIVFFVNTDYTVANLAFTNIYVSRVMRPLLFPARFAYTTTTGTAAGSFGSVSVNVASYTVDGGWIDLMLSFSGTLSSASTDYITATLPVALATMGISIAEPMRGADDGSYSAGATCLFLNGSATVRFYKTQDLGTTDYSTGTILIELKTRYPWI